ncbi:MAG TPA: M20/M25/M40 family metallo-hydrolase [Gemmatimonadaceae bacterium]
MKFRSRLTVALLVAAPFAAGAQTALTPAEEKIRASIKASHDDQIAYLERVVNIPSNTLNLAGVRKVGGVFLASLDSLGFQSKWVTLPDATQRAGHLVAEHKGKAGAVRILLIGHVDTVVEPSGPTWVRTDSMAKGVGSGDMKGGDVVILYALKALRDAGALDDMNITIVFTGDEEHPGDPLSVTRKDLIDAAKRTDIALAFEGGNRSDATTARRGASSWRVTATGRQAHSAGVFGGAGYGAIYEIARIVDEFRLQLAGEQYLTFNVGTIVGGTDVEYDTTEIKGSTASKLNIIPKLAIAHGDLRFISEEQKEKTRAKMRAIVAKHLPGTDAKITFLDEYPAMSPTAGNARILAAYDTASQALGYGPVRALDPGARGAGDISFVAPLIDGIDGLGALGSGAHAPDERVNLNALQMQTERAALLLERLGHQSAASFARKPASE